MNAIVKTGLLSLSAILSSPAVAHNISPEDITRMNEGGLLDYIHLGAIHMLTGYDHLLFLFGVMFFLSSFKDIAKFVTAFTLGHCITLVFATYLHITFNYLLVDAAIAASVIYQGFDTNNGFRRWFDMNSPNQLLRVFAFGLLHGFGLSTRLQQLPIYSDASSMLSKILSFNVGVELGQIAALVPMFIVLSLARKSASFKRLSLASNTCLIFAGVYLLFIQLHRYEHDHDARHAVKQATVQAMTAPKA
jgi:hydrogenase/urease accessory protein HupE